MRLLVVEDNRNLVGNLFEYFEPRGHEMDAAPDGIVGLHLAATQSYDAIVLDWMLPRLDGPALLQRLREHDIDTPVIMLTARDELPDKISGFRAGADDYLTKPFALPELEVRLEALLARSRGRRKPRSLQVHDLRLDLDTLEATRGGRTLHLYPAGRRLLQALMQASPAAVTRRQLEHVLWGDDPPDGDMLRSHIYELRRSVDAPFEVKLLRTLPRVGYRLAAPRDPADAP
ncbi:response regulator transcription factor [Luteimonas huabeiensis]|uniref:response regulator transcription factor n=1 Tax=Luteimonas huabeiensis TaxID=1244513 RepID=UPI00046466D1|nr:response regulator transcription factor [Luteimonas huabeiensis]